MLTYMWIGEPPDNADQFVTWLKAPTTSSTAFQDVEYAVFGCGHRDWKDTFQRIPTLVDQAIEKLGGKRKPYRNQPTGFVGTFMMLTRLSQANDLWIAVSPMQRRIVPFQTSKAGLMIHGGQRWLQIL